MGRFPFTKNSKKRVPFVTSSIRGSRGRPRRLLDREKYGTGDKSNKDEKSVNDGGVRGCGDAVLRYFWCGFAVIFILSRSIAVSKH